MWYNSEVVYIHIQSASMPQSASVIDTLGEGYRAIHRRPAVLLLALAFNLALLFSAPVSFAPLFDRLDGFLTRLASDPAAADGAVQSQVSTLLQELGQTDLRQPLALLNVMPRFVIPRFAPGALASDATAGPAIRVASIPGALLAIMAINLAVLPAGVLFLTLAGAAVRGEPPWPHGMGRTLAHVAVALLGAMAIFLAAGLILGVPLAFAAGLLLALNEGLGALAFSLLFVVVVWVQIYIGFTNEAIVMSRLGPLRAIQASFNIVRRNLWGTIGLLLLSLLIARGTEVIWELLSGTTAGLTAAALGSAYIGAGLSAARMAFYRERLRRMEERQPVRPRA